MRIVEVTKNQNQNQKFLNQTPTKDKVVPNRTSFKSQKQYCRGTENRIKGI